MSRHSAIISGVFMLALLAGTQGHALAYAPKHSAKSAQAPAEEKTGPLIVPPPIAIARSSIVELLTPKAEAGSARVQTELGEAYRDGNGAPKDDAKALLWLTKAANQGFIYAISDLGNLYLGEGAIHDEVAAASWYRKAADYGDGWAQTALGQMYDMGAGVPQDAVQAYKWVHLAGYTDMGDDNGRFLFKLKKDLAAKMTPAQIAAARKQVDAWQAKPRTAAQAETDGYHPPIDPARRAVNVQAIDGVAAAELEVGQRSLARRSSWEDETALFWLTEAAGQGYAQAQLELGALYAVGRATARGNIQAYKWTSLAIANQPDAATAAEWKTALEEVATDMTPAEIAEGRRQAETWTPASPAK